MKNILTHIFNIFNKTVEQVNKYGKSIVLWSVLLLGFTAMLFYFLILNEKLLDRYLTIQDQKQVELVEIQKQEKINNVSERRELNRNIYNLLNKIFYTHNCVQDIAIMEYHNTEHNLSNNSFLYVSNTFELCKQGDSHFQPIQRLNISLFNISNILYSNRGYYHSDMTTLKKDDMKLYSLIAPITEAKHIYIAEVNNLDNLPTACLVIVSNEDYSKNLEDTVIELAIQISMLMA